MNVISLMHQLANFPGYLVQPALRSLAVAFVAALLIAIMPRKRAALRLYVWTAVLYVAMAMPLLGGFLPRLKVPIPGGAIPSTPSSPTISETSLLSPSLGATSRKMSSPDATAKTASALQGKAYVEKSNTHPRTVTTSIGETGSASAIAPSRAPNRPPMLMRFAQSVSWKMIAVAVYFSGVVILLLRLITGLWWAGRLANSAQEVCIKYFLRKGESGDDRSSTALALLASHSSLAGLKHPPRLKESAALSVPATVGLRRAIILLPVGWRTWTDSKLEAVLAHEVSHVARRDAFTQLLSLLHRAIFWFSPLPWWLDRRLMELAEEASDEAALAGGADRMIYAETLLGFFARLQSVPGRVRWQALSMANRESPGSAERRVDRVLGWKGIVATKKSFVICLIALATPVVFLVASLHPFIVYANGQTNVGRLSAEAASTAATGTTRNAPEVQETSAPSQRPADQDKKQSYDNTNRININDGSYVSGPRYVIMSGNSNNMTMSGNDEDMRHALALRKQIKGDFIWFERDEKPYVITDPGFVQKAKALFAPDEELGRKQDELGRQQDELGRQQDALSEQIEKATVKVPDITPDLERIHARLKELQANGATQSELGRIQSQIGELQSRIGRLQSEVGGQQSEIGRRQGELGRKQGELGRQQGELGRRQGEIARQASAELRRMFDEAITKGIAKPE